MDEQTFVQIALGVSFLPTPLPFTKTGCDGRCVSGLRENTAQTLGGQRKDKTVGAEGGFDIDGVVVSVGISGRQTRTPHSWEF